MDAMNRRKFVACSAAALGGAVLPKAGIAAGEAMHSELGAPGVVAKGAGGVSFPKDFFGEQRRLRFRWRVPGMRMGRANQFGIGLLIRRGRFAVRQRRM